MTLEIEALPPLFCVKQDEFGGRGSPVDEALLLKAPIPPYSSQMFGVAPGGGAGTFDYAQQPTSGGYAAASPGRTTGGGAYAEPYYRDYFSADYQRQYAADGADVATGVTTTTAASAISSAFVERYVRQSAVYKTGNVALTVDLPSPDSGIGTDAITPRDQTTIQQVRFIFVCKLFQIQYEFGASALIFNWIR